MAIGQKPREVRRRQAITLQDVAEETGLSKSFLSQIESGDANPSIASLKKVADALDIPLAALFEAESAVEDPTAPGRSLGAPDRHDGVSVVWHDQRKTLLSPGQDLMMYLLSPDTGCKLEVTLNELQPGHDSGSEMYSHAGEECGFVTEGTLELTIEGEVYTLNAGDSIYFASHRPHRLRNRGDQVTRTLWVTTPPSY